MRPSHDKSYFHFTAKERNGILFLSVIAACASATSILYPLLFKNTSPRAINHSEDILKLEAKSANTPTSYSRFNKVYERYKPRDKNFKPPDGELFLFDPNLISSNEWKRLGLPDKTIRIIQNYLSKGGKFREGNDLKKIWGLDERLADRLIPFIRISKQPDTKVIYASTLSKNYTSKAYQTININDTDTSSLATLPGIGNKLSQRIIKYRDKLGGFYSVEQVAEIFGLPDSTFKKIRPWINIDKYLIKKININDATIEDFKAHPYIRYHLGNALIKYRSQHKNYNSVSEISNVMLVNDSIYKKVSPYLVVE